MRPGALPSSPEAERAVLAAVLLEPSLLAVVEAKLAVEDFDAEGHRLIYGAFLRLARAGGAIDLRTVQGELERRGELAAAGGLGYLATLDVDLPDLSRVGAYAEIVAERSRRRRVILAGERLVAGARRGALSGEELARQAAELAALAAGGEAGGRVVPVGLVALEALLEVEEGASGESWGGRAAGAIGTPFPGLDALTGGLKPGRLVIVGGRPGQGKTTFALNLAEHAALALGVRTLLVSLEMAAEELAAKLLSARARVPGWVFELGAVSENDWRRLDAASRELAKAPLYLAEAGCLTLERLEAQCRAQALFGLRLVVVDYLQLLELPRAANRNLALGDASRRLKLLAKELGLTVVLLSQLSREPERRQDPRPRLADLRESGNIEQDADLILFPFRREVYEPEAPEAKGKAEIVVAKNRFGALGSAAVRFEGAFSRFVAEEVEA